MKSKKQITGIRWIQIVAITAICFGCEKKDTPKTPYESINGFTISEKGEKFLATSNGLYSFNDGNGSIELAPNATPQPPLQDLTYTNNAQSQELWLASHEGVYNYSLQEYLNVANSGLHSDEVNQVHFDRDNNSYYATPEGISVLIHQDWTLNTGENNLYLRFEITDIGSTTNGFTYVTTYGGGIERFSAGVDGISGATIFDTDWSLLESNNINSVFIDDTVQVYGTDLGAAFHFSEETKRDWLVYTTKDGLINDTILSIVKDHADNWWFGTTRGISRLNGSQWSGYTMETHPIVSNQIKFLAVDPDGSVWMATDQGLSKFEDELWTSYPK